MLRDHDIDAYGVDHDPAATEAARTHHLRIVLADSPAPAFGRTGEPRGNHRAPSRRALGATEQITFVEQCRRALAPEMLLIETPNPANVLVGAATFYLDPTHQRPLPSAYLEFLVHDRGFVDVEVHAVHPVVEGSVLDDVADDPAVLEFLREAEQAPCVAPWTTSCWGVGPRAR